MIDIEEMKALAAHLRSQEAVDAKPREIEMFTDEAAAAIEDLLSELEAREADRRDAERYRKWVSYSGFTKEHADSTLDAIPINEYAALAQRQEGEEK
ncbi:hypothetical protein [Burkholderia ambifaria]|uniref:hypothetical protein n=1 Tax=Burkholderia ambifaria TaxID=152480 RepID=UPI0015886AC1|nr:hypothetical protein [Burkholderia ambifaria]